METLELICQEVTKNPHILSFSDIGQALAKGAVAGHKSGIAGGVVTGAILSLSLEASERAVLIAEDLIKNKLKPKY